jgi:serine phosphatase RsbU (regulator of sigma subunit)
VKERENLTVSDEKRVASAERTANSDQRNKENFEQEVPVWKKAQDLAELVQADEKEVMEREREMNVEEAWMENILQNLQLLLKKTRKQRRSVTSCQCCGRNGGDLGGGGNGIQTHH